MASIPFDEDDYQSDCDLRTLAQAEEIKKDPKRYKAALAKAKTQITELQKLTDSKQPAMK